MKNEEEIKAILVPLFRTAKLCTNKEVVASANGAIIMLKWILGKEDETVQLYLKGLDIFHYEISDKMPAEEYKKVVDIMFEAI